jgi:6-phosphogluconolactonase (cycloisomerase 2 family)
MTATTTFPEGEQRVYVINELQPYIYIFKLDDTFGILRDQGTVHTVHRPGQAGAELALHPTERWLYCSNRVLDGSGGSILVYKVLMDGNLENIQVR